MPALTQAQLADPRVRELIAAAFRTPRSLSPALESDLAALGAAPDFARALERVGEVEQGGAALPFALGGKFRRADAQRFGGGKLFGTTPLAVFVDEADAAGLARFGEIFHAR